MREYIELPAGKTAINTGNAAFHDEITGEYIPHFELERIQDEYNDHQVGYRIHDINGNFVGLVGKQRIKQQ